MKQHPTYLYRRETEKGQSMVELAVSFALIVFVLAGVVDFGRAYFALIALRDAAQEGVIYASVNPSDVSGIESRVKNSSSSPINFANFPSTDIDVSWNINGANYSEQMASLPTLCADFYDSGGSEESNWVKVSVEYDFPFTMPIIQEFFPGGILRLVVDDQHTILAPQCE